MKDKQGEKQREGGRLLRSTPSLYREAEARSEESCLAPFASLGRKYREGSRASLRLFPLDTNSRRGFGRASLVPFSLSSGT